MKLTNVIKGIFYVYSIDIKKTIFTDILFLIQTSIELYVISLSGRFIDATVNIIQNNSLTNIKDFIYTDSFYYLCFITALSILSILCSNLRSMLNGQVYRDFLKKFNEEIIRKLLKINVYEIESKEFQNQLSFVYSYSLEAIYSSYNLFSELIRQSIRAVSAMIILIQSLGYLSIIILLISLPLAIVDFYRRKNVRKYLIKNIERSKLIQYLESFIRDQTNFPELKVNRTFKHLFSIYDKNVDTFNKGINTLWFHHASDRSLAGGISTLLMAGFTVLIVFLSSVYKYSIGQFKALYDYSATAYDAFVNLFINIFFLIEKGEYIKIFYDLLEFKSFGDVVINEGKLGRNAPKLTFDKVDYQFKDSDIKVLENVSFTIDPGDKVAFIGGDGSGKTTLVKILCGLYPVMIGEYYANDLSVKELARAELKDKIALVPQDFNRYYFSLKNNITIGNPNVTFNKDLYEEVKRVVELDKVMEKEGYTDDLMLGKFLEGGIEISLGYWQRVAIARSLYRNRQILILDESFTLIDQPSRIRIMKNIHEFLGPSRTLIYVSQDLVSTKLFNKVYSIHKGKIRKKYNDQN